MNTGKIPLSSLKCKIFLLLGCPGFLIFLAETSPKIRDKMTVFKRLVFILTTFQCDTCLYLKPPYILVANMCLLLWRKKNISFTITIL